MGTVVISLDAELGWGHHDRPDPPRDRVENARQGWIRLLHTLDKYRIPATWAVVGHLFLDRCDGVHADHPAPDGWFARETGEWRSRPELRFGFGLVHAIQRSPVDHEIGSHTFSHVEFGQASRDLARAELAASVDTASDLGVSLDTLVFPRHRIGHLDLLSEYGITCYRGLSPDRGTASSLVRQSRKIARTVVPNRPPPVVEPSVTEEGLVDVPASMYAFGFEGPARTVLDAVWKDPIVEQARRGIDAAADRDDGIFHLWFHPNDISDRRDERRVEAILRYLAKRRDETALSVETMAEVAERTR